MTNHPDPQPSAAHDPAANPSLGAAETNHTEGYRAPDLADANVELAKRDVDECMNTLPPRLERLVHPPLESLPALVTSLRLTEEQLQRISEPLLTLPQARKVIAHFIGGGSTSTIDRYFGFSIRYYRFRLGGGDRGRWYLRLSEVLSMISVHIEAGLDKRNRQLRARR